MKIFEFCPACGSRAIAFDDIKQFKCENCSFTYFHNVAAAAAAILEYDNKILFIKRAREPQKGKLDLPGGFIDPDESAEEGLNRELYEELGITLDKAKYVGSAQNTYKYRNVTYNTCDLFFYSKIEMLPSQFNESEVTELVLKNIDEIPIEELAFESTKKGITLFKKSVNKH